MLFFKISFYLFLSALDTHLQISGFNFIFFLDVFDGVILLFLGVIE